MDWQKCTLNTPKARKDTMLTKLEKKLADDKAYKETLTKEIKCSQVHLAYRLAEETNDIDFVDKLQTIREDFHKRQLDIRGKKEQLLAADEEKRLKLIEEKRRLQLLQNSEDFRDFERQLHRARIAKQQALQILKRENQLQALQEAEIEQRHRLKSETELQSIIQERQKYMRDAQQRHYQNILLEQMETKQIQNEGEARLEQERERRQADELIKEMQEERQIAVEDRIMKRRSVQQTFENHWKLRNELREKEKLQQESDMYKVQQYLKQRDNRENMWLEAQNRQLRQISELKEKLGKLLIEEKHKKDEHENQWLKKQQFLEEQEQKKQDELALAMEERRRMLAKDSMTFQYKIRESQLFREMEEEERYRLTEAAHLARSIATDKERRHMEKEKQMEHLRQLKNMMSEIKIKSNDDKVSFIFSRHCHIIFNDYRCI
ncbi:hypothetical protein CHUAL_000943 [Chamberlinius hualienensis]